jgi:nucleotide-binding universal stress UspA family protein
MVWVDQRQREQRTRWCAYPQSNSSTPRSCHSAAEAGARRPDECRLTAAMLPPAVGARLVAADDPDIDLIVVGSAPNATPGRIALSGPTRSMLDSARSCVLVLPRETPVAL